MFTIKIADIPIGIQNLHYYIFDVSREYLTEEEPCFTVFASAEDIEYERELAKDSFPEPILEATAIYRKIAEKLFEYSAFVFHGAVIELDGGAYLFTAKSGVGKTTHIKRWLSYFGERASVLNGDKPVIRLVEGRPYVSGTPWRGKEAYGKPGFLPLRGIAFLERADENIATPVKPDAFVMRFAEQAHIPRTSARTTAATLSLLDATLRSVPLINLKCNMDISAARVAYEAFLKAESEFKRINGINIINKKDDKN